MGSSTTWPEPLRARVSHIVAQQISGDRQSGWSRRCGDAVLDSIAKDTELVIRSMVARRTVTDRTAFRLRFAAAIDEISANVRQLKRPEQIESVLERHLGEDWREVADAR